MSNRVLFLLSATHAPRNRRDQHDSLTAAARMPGRRRPPWASDPLRRRP